MSFTNYVPPLLNPEQAGAMPDLIGKLLSGYAQATKARYLQPGLEQELQKSKLFNQYYGRNMESQIGLRGAQAEQAHAHTGLLGEQTIGAHLHNQYLPDTLKAQVQSARLKALQDQMYNQMLQQRLSRAQGGQTLMGAQGQMGNTLQDYSPGQGQAPFAGGEQSPFSESQLQQEHQSPFDFNQAPELTNDDILNKKLFNIDTFTPRNKAFNDFVSKSLGRKEAQQLKLDADQTMADFKESSAAQKDLPVLKTALEHAMRMKDIIENRPGFFGHYLAPGLFAKRSTDRLSGEFQSLLVPQIAAVEQQLSQKGNQLALKTASQKLPGFEETQQSALGKADALINMLKSRIQQSETLSGGNIVRRGNKRFKFIDGHWYEVKRGDY